METPGNGIYSAQSKNVTAWQYCKSISILSIFRNAHCLTSSYHFSVIVLQNSTFIAGFPSPWCSYDLWPSQKHAKNRWNGLGSHEILSTNFMTPQVYKPIFAWYWASRIQLICGGFLWSNIIEVLEFWVLTPSSFLFFDILQESAVWTRLNIEYLHTLCGTMFSGEDRYWSIWSDLPRKLWIEWSCSFFDHPNSYAFYKFSEYLHCALSKYEREKRPEMTCQVILSQI